MGRASSESIESAGSRDLQVELAPRGDRRAALERSVRTAIRDGRLVAGGPAGLVIGYAAPPQHAYAEALAALGRALA